MFLSSRPIFPLLPAILLLFTLPFLKAQNSFHKTYGDTGQNSVAYLLPLADSAYLISGSLRQTGPGNVSNPYLLSLDKNGTVLWQKYYLHGTPAIINFILPANGGGFFLVGNVKTTVGGSGDRIWMMKTDDAGNVQWSKTLNINGATVCNAVRAMADGYLLAGRQDGYAIGLDDACLIKIDNNGDLAWNRTYGLPQQRGEFYDFLPVSDTLYAVGFSGPSGPALFTLSAKDGALYNIRSYNDPAQNIHSMEKIRLTADGQLMVLGDLTNPFGTIDNFGAGLYKLRKDGTVVFSKNLYLPGAFLILTEMENTADGGFILSGQKAIGNTQSRAIMFKIDAAAQVESAFQYTYGPRAGFRRALPEPGGGYIAIGSITPVLSANPAQSPSHLLLTKTLADGRVEGCCTAPLALQVADYTPIFHDNGSLQSQEFTQPFVTLNLPVESLAFPVADFCPHEPFLLSDTLTFCPGGSVVIGGTTYTQPGTVVDTLPSLYACDTIVTYTLQYPPSQTSTVSVQCPADRLVQAPAGATSAIVSYDAPVYASDCPCGGPVLSLLQGLPDGASFPLGATPVCFQVSDDCGSTGSCCFTVTVEQEPADDEACDTKTTACVTFEILGIFQNPAKQKTYRMRVTNQCAGKMLYVVFQLPDGVWADAPADNTIYTAPGGRQYAVRNPNFSPSWSVRFKTLGDGLAGGQSDVFEYTLPPQAAPLYIHAVAKLEPQAYYETHLNVFNCPVQLTTDKPGAGSRQQFTRPAEHLTVFPNPATDFLNLDLSPWEGQALRAQVWDARGGMLAERSAEGGTKAFRLDLPPGGPGGLYVVRVFTENGGQYAARFVRTGQ